jgi:integral membrane protein (TIGR01906 family)
VERAPWPVGLLFGVSLAIVILLAGPLLLFNPVFTSALQVRHDVAGAFGTTQPEIERVTAGYLADIYLAGPFDAALAGDAPLLDDDERSHMRDVSTLVRVLAAILAVAVVMAAVTGYRLRREPRRQGEIMLMAAGSIGATAVLLGAFFAIAFDRAFTVFHQLLFPPGTWQFDPGSDLITLFPEPFWFDAALAAGAAILLTAIVVSVIGLVRWRSTRDGAAPVSPA